MDIRVTTWWDGTKRQREEHSDGAFELQRLRIVGVLEEQTPIDRDGHELEQLPSSK